MHHLLVALLPTLLSQLDGRHGNQFQAEVGDAAAAGRRCVSAAAVAAAVGGPVAGEGPR